MAPRIPLLDILVDRFPTATRDELYRNVMCGEVRVGGATETNPRAPYRPDVEIAIFREKYVSRGGLKLDAALEGWAIAVEKQIWVDVGASTGGFTDCLLQRGAERVHAVDVGFNQISWRLRSDDRVVLHERTNITTVDRLEPVPRAAVCDLSFRSLRGILPHILSLTSERWGIALLKPQFEVAARSRRDGVVTPLEAGVVADIDREPIILEVIEALRGESIVVERRMPSPITGRSGNREELVLVRVADA